MTRRRPGGRAVGRSVLPRRGAFLVVANLVLTISCRPPDRPTAVPSRDSAGITIVADTAPAWDAGGAWRVGESALVDIPGGRPSSALRLSDGRIVVADGSRLGLQYYAADGRPLYHVGGAGDGDGALRSLYHLDLGRGDTVAAYDLARRQAVLFDPNGAFAGAFPVPDRLTGTGTNGFLPKGFAPDGRYLLQRDEAPFPFPGAIGSLRPDSTRVYWLTRAPMLADSTPRLQAGELFGFALRGAGGDEFVAPLARPLAPALRIVGGRDLVWAGDGATWELRGYAPTGALARIVRLPLRIDSLTPALRDTFVARYRRQVQGGGDPLQRQFAEGIAAAPFPARFPAFGDLLAGEDTTLWLLHVSLEEEAPTTWTVIGAGGRWLGDLTLPVGFRPTAAGRGWILGLQRDAGGTPHVRLYPLVER